MSSDVQVFVRLKDRCVFAGEELSCIITFRNTARSSEPLATAPGGGQAQSSTKRNGPSQRQHVPKRSISTNIPNHVRRQSSYTVNSPALSVDTFQQPPSQRPSQKHQRSVSIVSMSSPPISVPIDSSQDEGRRSPHLGHRRSSTVHLTSETTHRPSPGARQASSDLRISGRRSPLSASHIPSDIRAPIPEFKFPGMSTETNSNSNTTHLAVNKRPTHRAVASISQLGAFKENIGIGIYNHSNHSGETLMSEQTSMVSERTQPANPVRPPQRQNSVSSRKPKATTLLMGYAQVGATFTLDSSLVNQTQFDEVKKKGFLGGQAGGGVVGVKKKLRPGSGFFGGFNFGSIGESLENIIGGDSLSSVKEMRAVTSSRAIPLLSTPQSLLFVDLHLEPGEEKSYTFAYTIPTGLPSSHKGKAIRITYNLTIGIQGAPGAQEMQAVRQVNVPIRVFSGVDTDGEIFGHDLMQPYVILRDTAITKLILPSDEDNESQRASDTAQDMTSKDFLKYVNTLLDRNRRRQSSVGTLDFNIAGNMVAGASETNDNTTVRAINRAIFLSNQISSSTESSPNRFEIARSGLKIATVILDRPLHRLGETITTVIDFSQSQMTCTSLRATLETGERVDSSLAVRSASAISRITRKVYASQSDNVLFSKRAVFCATVPVTATPTFVTSGVNLDWYIKLEFGTLKDLDEEEVNSDEDSYYEREAGAGKAPPVLLEEIMKDERGVVNVAIESLDCETFEVAIPITVYGNMVTDGREEDEEVGIPI